MTDASGLTVLASRARQLGVRVLCTVWLLLSANMLRVPASVCVCLASTSPRPLAGPHALAGPRVLNACATATPAFAATPRTPEFASETFERQGTSMASRRHFDSKAALALHSFPAPRHAPTHRLLLPP